MRSEQTLDNQGGSLIRYCDDTGSVSAARATAPEQRGQGDAIQERAALVMRAAERMSRTLVFEGNVA
jgi:hypothetical protein